MRRTRRPRPCASRTPRRSRAERGSRAIGPLRSSAGARTVLRRPRATVERRSAPRPWCPLRAGFTASARRGRRSRGTRPSRTAPAFGVPKSRSELVSFSVKSSSGCAVAVERDSCPVRGARCARRRSGRSRRAAPRARASASPRPTTRCCGTRASAAGASVRGVGAAVGHRDADQDVLGVGLGVLDEDVEVAVLARRRRCRAARTPAAPCRAARFSSTAAPRTGTAAADTCRASACTSASACCPGRSSTPYVLAVVAFAGRSGRRAAP